MKTLNGEKKMKTLNKLVVTGFLCAMSGMCLAAVLPQTSHVTIIIKDINKYSGEKGVTNPYKKPVITVYADYRGRNISVTNGVMTLKRYRDKDDPNYITNAINSTLSMPYEGGHYLGKVTEVDFTTPSGYLCKVKFQKGMFHVVVNISVNKDKSCDIKYNS